MSDFLSQFASAAPQPGRATPQPTDTTLKPVATALKPASSMFTPLDQQVFVGGAAAASTGGIEAVEHRVEVDTGYRRAKIRRWVIIGAIAIVVVVAALLVWHFSRLVEVPDLTGKPVSAAQTFCRENGLTLEVAEEFSIEVPSDTILAQASVAGKSITKGSTLALTVSKGPDPDERLALPDFATMKRDAAEQWIAQNRADNLRLVLEYSDTVAKEGFLRFEFRSSDITTENYCRRDYASVYYSKGPEAYEKNIAVPDFANKGRADVETWAQTNSIELSVLEEESDTIAAGLVISQSIKAGEKVGKRDAFTVTISLGQVSVVPNFANYTAQTAAGAGGAAGGLSVAVETRFSADVAYGRLIYQSIPRGTHLLPDSTREITVVYSEGRPYLKDYRGTSEADLPATFFNDYYLKGANVTYEISYVDSSETKGNVVGMSDYNRFIPLQFHVVISVSKGNLEPPAEANNEWKPAP
ncbi:MAG: PASTA domain-containing protein [Coriobacteriales bacterium]|nr:PASTA domain-containing protein [Coriobacteriales bacterium]